MLPIECELIFAVAANVCKRQNGFTEEVRGLVQDSQYLPGHKGDRLRSSFSVQFFTLNKPPLNFFRLCQLHFSATIL